MAFDPSTIETFNKQMVSIGGGADRITVLRPLASMTKAEALTHAAWLVALADDDGVFEHYLNAVQNT